MNNKGVGAIFCLMTAARYLSAAVFMSGATSWDSDLFRAGLSYTGSSLQVAAVLALVVGVIFLGIGVYHDVKGSTVDKE